MPQNAEYQRMAAHSLTLFILSSSLPPTILIILLYPGSFASHGGEKINPRLNLSTYSIQWTSQALLDFSREFDVSLMDNVVTTLYSGSGGKEVSDLIFYFVSTLCLIAYGLRLPLATIGPASPDAIPR
jgi:hypothetical protein